MTLHKPSTYSITVDLHIHIQIDVGYCQNYGRRWKRVEILSSGCFPIIKEDYIRANPHLFTPSHWDIPNSLH